MTLSNICTYEDIQGHTYEDFDKHALNMKSWFLERGYSKQMIDSQMVKVGSKQAAFGVPFVITYHPKLKKILKIMKKLDHLLYGFLPQSKKIK